MSREIIKSITSKAILRFLKSSPPGTPIVFSIEENHVFTISLQKEEGRTFLQIEDMHPSKAEKIIGDSPFKLHIGGIYRSEITQSDKEAA